MFTETIQYLQDQGLTHPQVGLILGSGLGELAEDVENAIRIPYEIFLIFQSLQLLAMLVN